MTEKFQHIEPFCFFESPNDDDGENGGGSDGELTYCPDCQADMPVVHRCNGAITQDG